MTSVDDVANLLAQATVNAQHEITFNGKGLKLNTKEDVEEFVEEIRQCENMTALRMEGNSVGVEAAEEIGDALKEHPEFERAYWSDMFTGRLKNEIPNALEHLGGGIIAAGAGLVELELSDNAFGPNGLRGLVTFLKSPSCYTLKVLKLNNNGLGIFGGRMLADCLLECHQNSCAAGRPLALRVFVSGRNRLENQGAAALAEAFTAMGTLEEITMLQNFIQHKGVTAIARAIVANKGLRVLNLNDNTFTEKGTCSMAEVMPELPNLEVINFGDCLVRTEGAKALALALTKNHVKLKELILNGNEICSSAIDSLVGCVANKSSLENLDLNANEFGSDGVDRLQALLEESGRLDVLSSLSDDEGDDVDDDEEVADDNDEVSDAKSSDDEEVSRVIETLRDTALLSVDQVSSDQVSCEHQQLSSEHQQVSSEHQQVSSEHQQVSSEHQQVSSEHQQVSSEHQLVFSEHQQESSEHQQVSSEHQQTISVEEFLRDPSPSKYTQLGSEGATELLSCVNTLPRDVETSVNLFVQISLSVQANDSSMTRVCQCADELLSPLLSGVDTNPAFVVNCLLTNLGLLKHEDKTFVPPADVGAVLSVLDHSVRQSYFSKPARSILLTFIDRPHPLLDKSRTERHGLLQTLYSL